MTVQKKNKERGVHELVIFKVMSTVVDIFVLLLFTHITSKYILCSDTHRFRFPS